MESALLTVALRPQDVLDLALEFGHLVGDHVPNEVVVHSSGTFFAASPMISRLRTNARRSVSSAANVDASRLRLCPIR